MNKQFISYLNDVRSKSDGTSLITLYIPSEYNLWLAVDFLVQERSSASNIKDKNVRNDVISALKTGIYNLKSLGTNLAPKNGLVLCCGEISTKSNSYL